jgi:hypothetical protein
MARVRVDLNLRPRLGHALPRAAWALAIARFRRRSEILGQPFLE